MSTFAEQSSSEPLCRVCLANRSEMFSVFSELDDRSVIASIITLSTAVQIQEDDGLPENICSDCVEEVKFVAGFIEKARQSDRVLRNTFKTEIKVEEGEQLYALEIDLLDPPKKSVSKVEVIDDEEFAANYHDEKDESNDGNDSDYEGEQDSGSDEDYKLEKQTKRRKTSELNFVDANDVPSSDSDSETKPKRKKRSSTKDASLSMPISDELDEVEKETFTVIEIADKFLCCTCFKLFNTEEELTAHGKVVHEAKRSPNLSKKHVCKRCFRRYASKVALKAHLRQVSSITKVYDCRHCQARYASPLKRHQHAHNHPPFVQKSTVIVALNPMEAVDCGKICCAQGCNEVFDTEEQLLAHSEVAHIPNKVQASLNPDPKRPVQCVICYRRFIDEKGLKSHQQRPYMPKRHVCPICGLKFGTIGECKRHEMEHLSTEKVFKCDQCPKAYTHMEQLKAHSKRHTATREFMCNICGQSYLQRHNLQAHMLKHEGKMPFECDVCQKAFRVKAKMIYHKRVHSGERPFPCRYCEQAFADSTNRLRHEMSHTGLKPYKCDHCEKTFITKRLRRDHEKTHDRNPRRSNQTFKMTFDNSVMLE